MNLKKKKRVDTDCWGLGQVGRGGGRLGDGHQTLLDRRGELGAAQHGGRGLNNLSCAFVKN